MTTHQEKATRPAGAVAVSTAAGQARHFRVQYRQSADTNWSRYASFGQSDQASLCVRKLSNDGYVARLVPFAIAPAAG